MDVVPTGIPVMDRLNLLFAVPIHNRGVVASRTELLVMDFSTIPLALRCITTVHSVHAILRLLKQAFVVTILLPTNGSCVPLEQRVVEELALDQVLSSVVARIKRVLLIL